MNGGLRILMIAACPYPAPFGSQALIRETARALEQAGHTLRLVVYAVGEDGGGDPFEVVRAAPTPLGGRVKPGPAWGKAWADASLLRTVAGEMAAWRPNLLHAHNHEGLAVALLARTHTGASVPVVYHAHNVLGEELPAYLPGGGVTAWLGSLWDRWGPKKADAVIALHPAQRTMLVEAGCLAKRVHAVPPPLAPAALKSAAAPLDPCTTVLYTGNLDRYQNLPLLSAAWRQVAAARPDAVLRVVTPIDGARRKLRRLLPEADVVEGGWGAARTALAGQPIVAIPRTAASGLPIKLCNAMAAGCPIAACRSGAAYIAHGVDGWLAPDNDADAFAEGLLGLLDDAPLRERLGDQARETARRLFDPGRVAQQLETAYRSAL